MDQTKKTLSRDFDIAADRVSLKAATHPDLIK
jgi:hypothetical protein